MTNQPTRRVANPPAKPLMLFDGECGFCRRWIGRWSNTTAGAVEYQPFQEVGSRFPEIARADCERGVQLIEPDGRISSNAAAVFRSLSYSPGRRWLLRCYERLPGFAAASEAVYGFVARHRQFASAGTQLLLGDDVRRSTYFTARRWFLRGLGLIYLIAFVSLWVQVDGLVGTRGVLPVGEFLQNAAAQLGESATWRLPTLCWLRPTDGFLHLLCGAGVTAALVLMAGFVPIPSLVVAFVCYLSLAVAGQTFLAFQWDILLLETGFLAIFFAPPCWRLRVGAEPPLSRAGLFLLKLLLFKLMFMSGVVKLTSHDSSWWDLTALDYHYETQPLPTVLGWYAHQGPEWLKRASTAFGLFVELVVPFCIFLPRRVRLAGFALFVLLQIGIALTGNYAFFNLLTVLLCLVLLDDRTLSRAAPTVVEPGNVAWRWAAVAVLVLTLPFNALHVFSAFKPEAEWPSPLARCYALIEPLRVVNGYGLFRVMTKSRPEIVIEGSGDGIDWLPYEFKWKPGDVKRAPRWVAPHQPRLDWQMWFAALGSVRQNGWFLGLAQRLLQGEPKVISLLGHNPFPDKPPRFIRAQLYDYHFTTVPERRATGAWWKRQLRRDYMREVSREDFE